MIILLIDHPLMKLIARSILDRPSSMCNNERRTSTINNIVSVFTTKEDMDKKYTCIYILHTRIYF